MHNEVEKNNHFRFDSFEFSHNFGYACINTKLRKQGIFCSRTLRLDTLKDKGVEYAKELANQNLDDLLTILQWNVANNIKFMRLSSDMFPFSSHLQFGYSLSEFSGKLRLIGDYANNNGLRLSMHPGQYNVLSCKEPHVLANTIREVDQHSEILDMMNMGVDSVIILHGGGTYGDKPAAISRLKNNYMKLSESSRSRLVLENCEISYSIEDLLPISEELGIPLVLDFHHNQLNPSKMDIHEIYNRVYNIWKMRGITPKIHVSNTIPGMELGSLTQRRKHSDYIDYFHEEIYLLKDYVDHMDIMLECKMKEDAIFSLSCPLC
jgi:UV DNA damage endonuclease